MWIEILGEKLRKVGWFIVLVEGVNFGFFGYWRFNILICLSSRWFNFNNKVKIVW